MHDSNSIKYSKDDGRIKCEIDIVNQILVIKILFILFYRTESFSEAIKPSLFSKAPCRPLCQLWSSVEVDKLVSGCD